MGLRSTALAQATRAMRRIERHCIASGRRAARGPCRLPAPGRGLQFRPAWQPRGGVVASWLAQMAAPAQAAAQAALSGASRHMPHAAPSAGSSRKALLLATTQRGGGSCPWPLPPPALLLLRRRAACCPAAATTTTPQPTSAPRFVSSLASLLLWAAPPVRVRQSVNARGGAGCRLRCWGPCCRPTSRPAWRVGLHRAAARWGARHSAP